MNPIDGLRTLWTIYSTLPRQAEEKDALLAIASIAAVLWTGGIIAIQLDPNRARARAVLGMEYLQFAFFAPVITLVAEPLALRTIATIAATVIFVIGVDHIRRGAAAGHLERLFGPNTRLTLRARLALHAIRRNLLYYGRWTVASTAGAVIIAVSPTQTTVAWTSIVVAFVGLQIVVRFLNFDEP